MNTLKLELSYGGVAKEFVVNIIPKDIEKFTSDTFYVLDAVLQEIISLDRFKLDYSKTTDEQKVTVDDIIEGLKNE